MLYFGMFGFGGPFATMHLGRVFFERHLGRRAAVASKTCISKKVYLLYLEREALLSSSSEHSWRANGGIRDPNNAELAESPHRSFTKIQIRNLRLNSMNLDQLRCRLKDIYFPYIQCDELSGTSQTRRPIEFEVNGMDLAEVITGEAAVTNMHSCNGPEFTLQLQFTNEASNSVPVEWIDGYHWLIFCWILFSTDCCIIVIHLSLTRNRKSCSRWLL